MKFATVKKWLALLLASCMVMALAACGKTADAAGTTGGDAPSLNEAVFHPVGASPL